MGTWRLTLCLCLLFGSEFTSASPIPADVQDVEVLKYATGSLYVAGEKDQDNFTFYSPNSEYHWRINTAEDSYIILESEYFDVETSQDCMFDALTISDGDSVRKFCGSGPLVYISQSNVLGVTFKSDESYEGHGFNIKYRQQLWDDVIEGFCNSVIIGGAKGEIRESDDTCYYRIQASPGQFVRLDLVFTNFGNKATCEDESIKIYRGLSTHGELLKEICSVDDEGPIDVSEEKLFIEYRRSFESDLDRFIIKYRFADDPLPTVPAPVTTQSPVGGDNDCSGFIKDRQTGFTYEVPHYMNDRECTLVVRNTQLTGKVIQITFEYFDLEDIEGCVFDSLKVISGEKSDSQSLGGPYCGESLNGRTFLTYGNALRLEYKTDESLALYGFKAKIDFVKRSECECGDGKVCVKRGFEKECHRGYRCLENPCKNGGTCIETRAGPQCYCRSRFSGDTCITQKSGHSGYLEFLKQPEDKIFERDSSGIGTCMVKNPAATYTWTFQGEPIYPYQSSKGYGILANKFLKIDKFKERMEGEYTCTATVGNTSAEIYFYYKLVESCKAGFIDKPSDQRKAVGDLVTLECRTVNAIKTYWEKDGVKLDIEQEPRFSLLLGSNILSITDVQQNDQGIYTCVAEGDDKCQTRSGAELRVENRIAYNDYCGVAGVEAYISQGDEARRGQFPWQVIILDGKRNTPFCGGSLISRRYVMTAAHCINSRFDNPENVKLIFGGVDCNGDDKIAQRFPKRVIMHPSYKDGAAFNNDIALIELNKAVDYDTNIRPVCLQRYSVYNSRFFTGSGKQAFGFAAGCGTSAFEESSVLMHVRLPLVDRENCEENYEGKSRITDTMLCAGFRQYYKGDVCSGDSGGAFTMTDFTDGDRHYQVGIVSHGYGDCDEEFYPVFTSVGKFYDWIKDHTEFDQEEIAAQD